MSWQRIEEELRSINEQGLLREFRYLESAQMPRVKIRGKDVLLLSSNNYLGLCNDERLKIAAKEAIDHYGVGSGGSRLTTGSYDLHRKLEQAIADFKNTEAAIVFNTGYMANVGVISAIAGKDWIIFSDSLNHASIIDGCRLSGTKTIIYKHVDLRDLENQLKEHRGAPGLIVTDGVFSMDGDIAPVPQLAEMAHRYGMLIMVDDAHATGVLGHQGGGTSEYFGLQGVVDISMGTLSKSLAGEGGFVAGRKLLIDYLKNRARSFIFSTAMSPQMVAVSLRAIEIMRQDAAARETLMENARWFRQALRQVGFQVPEGITPIIPVIVGDALKTLQFSLKLLEEGIQISAVRPPVVAVGTSRLRITLMANHTRDDLNCALEKIKSVGGKLGVI
ncbi:MAG TPA: 8-amino-7-oxononanoate synthase [Smithellaceae bacterium]|nr:8-amino-7-oxononanoate synthase [Smithellaceae bacterium]HRV44802.1 8-amino-7-oxononanoate synthase [Smithellaceae bacterium]